MSMFIAGAALVYAIGIHCWLIFYVRRTSRTFEYVTSLVMAGGRDTEAVIARLEALEFDQSP